LFNVDVAGVYTRNRNFRLLMSTKLGKSSGELRVARTSQFQPRSSVSDGLSPKRARLQHRVEDDADSQSLERTFLDSLICNVEYVPLSCYVLCIFRLHQMREMQSVVTMFVLSVCPSVCRWRRVQCTPCAVCTGSYGAAFAKCFWPLVTFTFCQTAGM